MQIDKQDIYSKPTPQPPPVDQPVEIFSEISLDPDSQDTNNQYTISDNYYSQSSNPLEESNTTDRNPLQSPFAPINPLSSLTNPAAQFTASLSQLPSVASSVFSSFSSILGRTSAVVNPPKTPPEVEYKSSLDNLLGGHDNSNQYTAAPVPLIPATQYTSPTTESVTRDLNPPPVPIYSGSSTQIPSAAPPTSGGGNNYRLHSRKTYAQVPGLCRSLPTQQSDTLSANKSQDQFVPLNQPPSNFPPLPVPPAQLAYDGKSASNEVNLTTHQPQNQSFPAFNQFYSAGNSSSNVHLYDNSIPTSIHPTLGNLNVYSSDTNVDKDNQSNIPYWSPLATNSNQTTSVLPPNIFNPVSNFEQTLTELENPNLPATTIAYSHTQNLTSAPASHLFSVPHPDNSIPSSLSSSLQNQGLPNTFPPSEQVPTTNTQPPPPSFQQIQTLTPNYSDLQNIQPNPLPPPVFSGFTSSAQIHSIPPASTGYINQGSLQPVSKSISPSPQIQGQSAPIQKSPVSSLSLPPPPTGTISSFRKQDLPKTSPFSNYPKPPQLNTSAYQPSSHFTGLPSKPNLFPAPPPLASVSLASNVQIFNPASFVSADNNTSTSSISTSETLNSNKAAQIFNPASFVSADNNTVSPSISTSEVINSNKATQFFNPASFVSADNNTLSPSISTSETLNSNKPAQFLNPASFASADNNILPPSISTSQTRISNVPASFFTSANNLVTSESNFPVNQPFDNQSPVVNSGRSSVTSFISNLNSERNSESPATIIPDTKDLNRQLSETVSAKISIVPTEESVKETLDQEKVQETELEISTKSYFEQNFSTNPPEPVDNKSFVSQEKVPTDSNLFSAFSNTSTVQSSQNSYQQISAADFFDSSYAINHNITDTVTQFAQSTPNFFTQQPPTTSYFPPTTIYSGAYNPMATSDMTLPQDFAGMQFSSNNQETENLVYRPVYQHWFYKKDNDVKAIWEPFSMVDSMALEESCTGAAPDTLVPTDGGRYDVNICTRTRVPVFWTGNPTEVRRCSWFFKTVDSRFIPYEEPVASRLEEEYKLATETNEWHRRVSLPNGETVVFHGPQVIVHYLQAQSPDAWGNTPQTANRPRVVKRGLDEFDINDGDPKEVDHLLFLVHGIGSVCDLKFRTVEEVVDEFRSSSLQLIQSHYRSACDRGEVNRVEVLPVSWHGKLHSDETGIDKKLKAITLESIPKLRNFTNDTLLDILFYTSPMFCENIMQTVGNELNRLYALFRKRNPSFKGGVSLGGHSLGSLIMFDLLCHQKPTNTTNNKSNETVVDNDSQDTETNREGDTAKPLKRVLSRKISYVIGHAGTGQPYIKYPQLDFSPDSFFALGSPIGMFVTVRGIDSLGLDFALPTCPGFFNIFHPYDPVAYRIEALVNPDTSGLRPVLIPHHKGRKRMHLELKDTMTRVGADLKQRLLDSVRSTWNSVYQMAVFKNQQTLEEEVDKVLVEQLNLETNNRVRLDSSNSASDSENPETDLPLGRLNSGRRIDYVLQEAPLEFFNDYIFAVTSHVCYWESEDTMLLILKEIYKSRGITTDSQIAQPTMTIERPASEASSRSNSTPPTTNICPPSSANTVTGPPPSAGFIRK